MTYHLKCGKYYFHSFDDGVAWVENEAEAKSFTDYLAAEKWLENNSSEFLKHSGDAQLPEIVQE